MNVVTIFDFSVIQVHFPNYLATGLDNGTGTESVMLWSLAENKIICSIQVDLQVAVIKLSWPDILMCGHLDGCITTFYFQYTCIPETPLDSSSSTSSSDHSPVSRLQYKRRSFRAHTSAVISLELNKVTYICTS